jgi:hypothetical protein
MTDRAAAIASAFVLLFALVATDVSGAFAQDAGSDPLPMAAPAEPADAQGAEAIRFVAGEVVQPLPHAAPSVSGAATSLQALVASMGQANLDRDLHCLATAIYFEARGESLDGQLAVGEVIINRTESRQFPRDYCGVVVQKGQFSFVRGSTLPSPPQHSAAWHRASAIARIAHENLWDSAADDALFFHASRVRPSWASRKLARAQIDNHLFYR